MMKMATGDGIPLRKGAGKGSQEFLVATEACGGGTPDLSSILEVLGYIGIYRRKKHVRGVTRSPRGWRERPGGWAHPLPHGFLVDPLTCTPSLPDCFLSKDNSPEGFIPFDIPFLKH